MEKWLEPQTIALWILIAFAVIGFLLFSFIKLVKLNFKKQIENQKKETQLLIQHQKNLMQTSILAQEQERNRIAADLHDSLIGKLTVLRMKTALDISHLEIGALLEDSISEARRISHDLSPPMIETMEIEEVLENLIFNWNKIYKIEFYKNIRSKLPVSDHIKLQLVRIIQELIVNTHKHAQAGTLQLLIKKNDNYIYLLYKDNGKGFNINLAKNGLGLKNIDLRLNHYNGRYKLKSGSKGTTIIISIKYNL